MYFKNEFWNIKLIKISVLLYKNCKKERVIIKKFFKIREKIENNYKK